MLIDRGLFAKLWLETLSKAYYIINILFIKVLQKKMLIKVWHKGKFDIFNLCIYKYYEYVVDYKAKI